jgi:hypothetical protein
VLFGGHATLVWLEAAVAPHGTGGRTWPGSALTTFLGGVFSVRYSIRLMQHPIEFSIVVVAQDCNPTIVNPDFLERCGIVPEDWGWKLTGPPITTPPFATVSYDSGITVTVETTRFLVVDRAAAGDVAHSKAPAIATRYIEVLPHVRYTAVGINFRTLVEMPDADAYVKGRFLKTGPWDSGERPLRAVSLTFSYALDGGRLNLSLEGAAVLIPEGDQQVGKRGVLVSGNFHRDCVAYPSDKEVVAHIGRAAEDGERFRAALVGLLQIEETT